MLEAEKSYLSKIINLSDFEGDTLSSNDVNEIIEKVKEYDFLVVSTDLNLTRQINKQKEEICSILLEKNEDIGTYFCSAKYCIVNNKLIPFNKKKCKKHEYILFCDDYVVKYIEKIEDFRQDIYLERDVINALADKYDFVKKQAVIDFVDEEHFVNLVRKNIKGESCKDRFEALNGEEACYNSIRQTFQQLHILEKEGFIYTDLKLDNILYDFNDNTYNLIDLGSVENIKDKDTINMNEMTYHRNHFLDLTTRAICSVYNVISHNDYINVTKAKGRERKDVVDVLRGDEFTKKFVERFVESGWCGGYGEFLEFFEEVVSDKKSINKFNNKKWVNMKKIKIVFLYRGNSFWLNNHSFYKECLWDGDFDIWVVPESNYIDPDNLAMFKKDKVNIIEKNIKNGEYFDLRRLNPDYVLLATPYTSQRNKIYNAKYLNKFTKVLYIPYGPENYANYNKDYFYSNDFYFHNKIFLQKNDMEIYSKYINKNKLIISSHPTFDLFQDSKYIQDFNINNNILWKFNKTENKKRLLWTPHWTINKWGYLDTDATTGNSDFIKFADLWLKIPKLYPQLDIVMRPHPNLFRELPSQTNNEWDEEKIKNWKMEFENNNNTTIDNSSNYCEQFITCDAFINSSLSFTVLLINTKKPILTTRNIANAPHLNISATNIENSYYKAHCEQDIIDFIENVVIGGNDPMYQDREKAFKENIFIPEGGSGNFIKNYIKKDWYNNSHKALNVKDIFNTIKKVNI